MDRLWAPWRFKYIKAAREGGESCIFVELPAQQDDRKNLILFRGKTAFVMLNAFPYNNGHLMIAPYRHTRNLQDLTDEELLEIQHLIRDCMRWLHDAYHPDGYNVGLNLGRAAGAGIDDHIHWHVVPRWSGDTNFMPVVGETRVLPQSLEDSYDLIAKAVTSESSPDSEPSNG